jgi:hypothetical protein
MSQIKDRIDLSSRLSEQEWDVLVEALTAFELSYSYQGQLAESGPKRKEALKKAATARRLATRLGLEDGD